MWVFTRFNAWHPPHGVIPPCGQVFTTHTGRYSHFEHLDGDRQGPRPAQGAVVFSKAVVLEEQRVSPVRALGRGGDRQGTGQSLLDPDVQRDLGQARQHVRFTKPLLRRPLGRFRGPEVFGRRRKSLFGQVQGARRVQGGQGQARGLGGDVCGQRWRWRGRRVSRRHVHRYRRGAARRRRPVVRGLGRDGCLWRGVRQEASLRWERRGRLGQASTAVHCLRKFS